MLALANAVKDEKLRVREDKDTVIIRDAFPKARHHFLVLPKPLVTRGPRSFKQEDSRLVEGLLRAGEDLAEKITTKNPEVKFRFGFHAIPSMGHLHMHVISQDFDSQSLRNKKHWNSFTTEFFLDADVVIERLKSDGHLSIDTKHFEALLKQDLSCPLCKTVCANLPKMKEHFKRCQSAS